MPPGRSSSIEQIGAESCGSVPRLQCRPRAIAELFPHRGARLHPKPVVRSAPPHGWNVHGAAGIQEGRAHSPADVLRPSRPRVRCRGRSAGGSAARIARHAARGVQRAAHRLQGRPLPATSASSPPRSSRAKATCTSRFPAAARSASSSRASARAAATWQGTLHFTLAPRIDDAGRVRVSIVDSRASGMAPALWEAGKRHLHPRLERFSYDLGASREALAGLLRGAAPPAHAAAMEQALQKVRVLAPRVEADPCAGADRDRRAGRLARGHAALRCRRRLRTAHGSRAGSAGKGARALGRVPGDHRPADRDRRRGRARCAGGSSRCCSTAATGSPRCSRATSRWCTEIRCARCSSRPGASCARFCSKRSAPARCRLRCCAMRSSSTRRTRSPPWRPRRRGCRCRPTACASSRAA